MEEVRITPLVWRVLVRSADYIVRMVADIGSDCDADFFLYTGLGILYLASLQRGKSMFLYH